MRPPSRTARLQVALECAPRRLAQSEAALRMADETCEMALVALERSRRLLAQSERSRAGEGPHAQDLSHRRREVTVIWVY